MSELIRTLVCRPVHGFSLYSVWSGAIPPRLLKYEIELPSRGLLPFPRNALGAALKTFHASTDVWVWFSSPYRLYPVFPTEDSNEVSHYAISGPDGEVFRSCEMPDGVVDALIVFERLTGVDVTADDAPLATSEGNRDRTGEKHALAT